MCAIAGIVGGDLDDSEIRLLRMLSSMKHRGPDYTDFKKLKDDVLLGHNRLGIIDLHASSNQPFVSEDGRYSIVFNGEIYNYLELRSALKNEYTFKTNSDTEVLLQAFREWGISCLDKLIGMFAFAIWDRKEELLFAARDRFGVKPFYYTLKGSTLLFASEIKAFWEAGIHRRRSEKAWASYFVYGDYGAPSETFWEDLKQLPAGHYLLFHAGKVRVQRWYFFEEIVQSDSEKWIESSEEEIVDQIEGLLHESIQLRFRSDVKVGFNVSGGLDSSILLSLIGDAFPYNRTIRAFTFYTGDPSYDELPWVQALMGLTNYPLSAVQLRAIDVPSLAEKMAFMQDEPYGGIPTLAYSILFREARQLGTIVLLDGQGIDEAWAGYDYYQTNSESPVQGVTGSPFRPLVLMEDFRRSAEKPSYPTFFKEALQNRQYRDLFYTKLPRALRFNDRASMMYGTELREPFLDHRLVEMSFGLPRDYKIRGNVGKYLLRKVGKKRLPESISYAPKRSMQTPQREWLRKELQEWADTRVKMFGEVHGIDKPALLKEWDSYVNEGSDNSFYVWQFINSSFLLS